MNENLVDVLINQHNNLKREIAEIKTKSKEATPNFSVLLAGLEEFKKSLAGHLNLENGVFYPKLLEKLEGQGLDTSETRKFIDDMHDIERQVVVFLEKYDAAQKIEKNFQLFGPDLNEIIAALLLRIYSEENGVYLYWE